MRRTLVTAVVAIVVLTACGGASGGPLSPSPAASTGAPGAPTSGPSPAATAVPAVSAAPVALSPRGRIAFIRPAGIDGRGEDELYVVDAAGGTPTRLTADSQVVKALYWLLDGSRLVYAWSTHPNPYQQTLTSIRADATDRRDLGPAQTLYSPPAISPDGRTVVFSGDGSEDGSSGLVLLDLVAGTRTQLTTDGATGAIWSPDGKRLLAFLPSRRVVVIDAASGAELARISDAGVDSLLGWSPDGTSIIYHGCGPDLGKIQCMNAAPLVANADGTNVRVYSGTLPNAAVSGLASPDGRWIVTSTADASNAEGRLSVAAASGGPAMDLAVGSSPAWSPDSNWIVFAGAATEPAASSAGLSGGLFVVSREGGVAHRITDGPYDQAQAWQPR